MKIKQGEMLLKSHTLKNYRAFEIIWMIFDWIIKSMRANRIVF